MVDLSSEIEGVKFKNPFLLAGGPGVTGETLKTAGSSGAGGVVTKTFRLKGMKQVSPRIFQFGNSSLINIEGPSEQDAAEWMQEIKSAQEGGAPVISSIIGAPVPPYDEITELAKMSETAGAEMLEYVLFHAVSKKGDYKKLGVDTTQDPEVIYEITKAIRKSVKIPISIKLPPSTLDIVAMAKAAEEGGANAITAINTLPNCLAGVDIYTGKPLTPALGNYSGAGIKPLGLGSISRIANSVSIPVVGVGGILTWKDAVEYIMVGAHHVEICTAFFLKGFKIFREMVNGVKEFMEEKGYEKIEDMRGIALKHIRQFQELERVELHAEINEEVCNACKKCVKSCVYGAIVYRAPETIAIDAQKCGGCGMCSEVCPVNAISMK